MRISKSLATAILICAPAVALAIPQATPEPGRAYRVVDVAAGDTLTIRAAPHAQAERVGELAADAPSVHVAGTRVEAEGSVWWQVLQGDGTGWVNARYLTLVDPAADPEQDYPLLCSGTEPFWNVVVRDDQAAFEVPGEAPVPWKAGPMTQASGSLGRYAVRLEADGDVGYLTASRNYHFCSDGMSDINFPFDAILIAPGGEVYGGCCARTVR